MTLTDMYTTQHTCITTAAT